MKRCLFAVFFLLCIGSEASYGQASDSCLVLAEIWQPDSIGYPNPDSVKIDSCLGSATYNQFYAKKWFGIVFDKYVIKVGWGAQDSLIELTWEYIDTSYSDVRADFEALETLYGHYKLIKQLPTDTSGGAASRYYTIRFENYVSVDLVDATVRSFGHGAFDFMSLPGNPFLGVVRQDEEAESLHSFPNPADDYIFLEKVAKTVDQFRYEVRDILGRLLIHGIADAHDKEPVKIDVKNLPSGSYFIIVDERSKLIIKR